MDVVALARRTLRFLGIDRAVAFTLAGHLWTVVSAPLLLVLVVRYLSAGEQGVLFNFVSISSFLFLFANGVGTAVQQLASRERAFLALRPDGTVVGDARAKARLAGLFRIGLGWFLAIMVVSDLVLLPVGWGIFSSSPGTEEIDWRAAWALTVLVTAAQAAALSLFLFLSGVGYVTAVARVTALQQAFSTLALAVGLVLGFRLLAHPLSMAAGLALSAGWLVTSRSRLLADLWSTGRGDAELRWGADVWPMQWRVTVTWLCLMAVVQMIDPFVLRFQGAAAAGRVGLSMYVLKMVLIMGRGWVGTKVPQFGVLAARREWAGLDRAFGAVLARSLGMVALLGGLVVLASAAAHAWEGSSLEGWSARVLGPGPAARLTRLARGGRESLLAPLPLGLLALATAAVHVIGTQMAYLRAHGREPMLPLAVALAAVVAGTLALTGWYTTLDWMIGSYALWIVVPGLGGATLTFWRKRRQWHDPAVSEPAPDGAAPGSRPDGIPPGG